MLDPYKSSRDQRTYQDLETVFPPSSNKAFASVFWDNDEIVLVDYLGRNESSHRHGKVLYCTSQQTEAGTGLQTSGQASERMIFFKTVLLFTKGLLRTSNWQIFVLKC
jgi:hypothetical protein